MSVTIALVGDRQPCQPSHRELDAVRGQLGDDVAAEWVATDSDRVRDLGGFDGIWLVPGSPYADDSAAYEAVRWARENDVPFLGTCGGLQYAVVEYFRDVLGVSDASHAESDGSGAGNVVHALSCRLQGEERVVRPLAGTRFSELVEGEPFVGMHYCSYGPGPDEVERLVEGGMVVEATAEDAGAELLELPANRFFMLTLFPAAHRRARGQAAASAAPRVRAVRPGVRTESRRVRGGSRCGNGLIAGGWSRDVTHSHVSRRAFTQSRET